jgi:hypothetical protein
MRRAPSLPGLDWCLCNGSYLTTRIEPTHLRDYCIRWFCRVPVTYVLLRPSGEERLCTRHCAQTIRRIRGGA